MDTTEQISAESARRRRRGRFLKRRRRLSGLFSPVYFIVTFLYIELVFHITEFQNVSALFPALFAVPAGILAGAVCNLCPEKVARVLRYLISAAVILLTCVQIVYFHSFQSFMSVSQVSMGDDVFTNFFKTILLAVWERIVPIVLILLPLPVLALLHKFLKPDNRFEIWHTAVGVVVFALVQLLVISALPLAGTGDHSAYANYHNNWVLDLSMEKLGVLTTTGLDLKCLVLDTTSENVETDLPVQVTVPDETKQTQDSIQENTEETVGQTGSPYNIIEGLDFAALAQAESDETCKQILQYLDGLEPTKKNDYTGMFAGYNLILITAESFSPMGIHEELTPTLHKLANSGFDFTNYWTMYPSNTTNGEYSNLTGLVPDISKPKSDGSFVFSIKNTMNQNIANYFNAQGITSRGYHDHTGSYYKRNQTHPNIGYTFKGRTEIGGLSGWPESDLTMMEKTVDEYINEDRFHTYYMTVSGHHNYKFGGFNSIADKNQELVDHLDMPDCAKAYIATHIELDSALEYLIRRLEEAGKLEKTVICITTDHYPYGLTDAQYKDMLGHSLRFGGMERYSSDLIIWNSQMEKVTVDKPCCQVDVLPTLLNLFGFEYDSRLYSGADVFSDSYGVAMMSNQSFVTDKIIYNSRYEKVYKLDENWEMPEGYLESYIQIVKNRFSVASNILNYDFYAKLPAELVQQAQKGMN